MKVSMRDANVDEISGICRIGIFFEFPEDSCQEVVWIPKGRLADVELMRKIHSHVEAFISSLKMVQ